MHNNVICCLVVFSVLSFVLGTLSLIFLYIGMLLKEHTVNCEYSYNIQTEFFRLLLNKN